ncbi:MarR family winged helix-turn-helix transcriptional regulator [Burkholderiaceae bacterium FT117]|uniref:MarR family winged helix-turn-helix transcriptional regulator n=1 Tax=Zeimonas sediminis TaxID=2944268 RepID=UPI002342BFE8|nr:MarR family winged helix-turn-helix transcriptional regulator [Zeimonas sediminis]MCM5570353.1 MarR family winged helix-turn-helix transcriptional regulator [Zeimonas sediminis]
MTTPTSRPSRACTNFRLRQLTRRVTQFYDAELGKAGIRTTQYALLSHVLKLGPVRPGELARAMTMDASTLTRNLRPLVEAGWIEISAGPDARSRMVTITEAGRARREAARDDWQRAQTGLEARLGRSRVLALHALIDESLALLDAPADGDIE